MGALEDDPILNAGYGSNLNMDGKVECDAAVMSGSDEAFGSVAAVSGGFIYNGSAHQRLKLCTKDYAIQSMLLVDCLKTLALLPRKV